EKATTDESGVRQKELVHSNFLGLSPERLLERMVELSLYTEEHLR
ncbi:MAG: hypothetical protein H6Q06_2689, partial [Acidobacteria bacterium]|nr:hypothetical protein [Acidobacteriota bacterium]